MVRDDSGMVGWNSHSQTLSSAVPRYSLAVAFVLFALAPALVLQHYEFRDVELPLFLFAVALTAWYAGVGPSILSIVVSAGCFDYFFVPPVYSFYFTLADLPKLFVLVLFAALIAWFSSIRHRVELQLRQARDQLQVEVAERTQQASLLNLTHDTIFVRDMDFVITYWNRGAAGVVRMGAGGSDWEALRRSSADRFPGADRRDSRGVTADRALGGRTQAHGKRTEPRWWWPADGRCGATNRNGPLPSWKRATTSPSTSAGRRKFATSTRNWRNGPPNWKPPTRSWKLLPIPFPTTCARLFAIWPGMRSCFRKGRLPSWTKRAADT